MKYRKITSAEIQENIKLLTDLNIQNKEQAYNLIYLTTNNGILKIKTTLSKDEWIKSQGLKLKKKNQCKRK